jgi:hypothetical protein
MGVVEYIGLSFLSNSVNDSIYMDERDQGKMGKGLP